VNFKGWIKEEIEENSSGVYVNPRQPDNFKQKVLPILQNNDMLQQYQQAARTLAVRKHSRTHLVDRFVKLFS
jgi:hypothetical protein